MYKGYFGLKESPFSIAPNPRFLFMSERHKEALAHLSYGLGETGGFALLTGEVGTGKTTISRRLMEQLPENTQAAFILNPTLSSQELLATVCDELKIRYRKTGATLKTLTDKIYEKLNKNHQANLNTLLIIDEAQHLAPEVLEQLRLLTNLETDTKKLLQVILIGQPELKQLLQRRDLRQLAQRITARYHLLPLTKSEVGQYIQHRLSVAQCERMLFERAAVAEIHRISQGIPRIINLLCERSLTNAYCSNNALVTKKIVLQSAQEALGDEYEAKKWWQHLAVKSLAASVILVLIISSSYLLGQLYGNNVSNQTASNISKKTINHVDTVSNNPVKITVDNENKKLTNKNKVNIVEKPFLAANAGKNIAVAIKNDGDKKTVLASDTVNTANTRKGIKETPTSALLVEPRLSENKPTEKVKQKLSVNAADGISDALLARFKSAIDDTERELTIENKRSITVKSEVDVPTLSNMPAWVQSDLPPLSFEQHIYTSDGESWVKVNGRDRYEGDTISNELVLNYIYAQKVILTFKGEQFSLPALSSW
ncbi:MULTISPECIES: AAA family ATPase [unclassified Colwellia]|uniref:AAA family ATPase n=1 Tax=unclassified Colwellia TaxID=196834 RepID=UPI0015F701AC|nr:MULTISPECIES: AAA family ATPase [unclassified Colwellia]MBA6233454.1 AAA family ATPase [Colwellia sp. MB02u-7]MBA6236544.1 AAA family ATPase [Colwellia sp. MB02u-11]MBA6257078.1 AAA family ATPase [Colwellia sp. MB3u-28]MBA6260917.1 AAA family ATPase [Colwellia sp. MB3u-41]MBA6298057.1 AAA family ATPase [Colwellia sp. MB3u-22]